MLQHLAQLLAEQGTPPELAAFIAVVAALCVVGTALAYIGIMTVAWLMRLRPALSWRQVVLPDMSRFRRLWPEYLLAAATSSVLAVTLAEKHEVVDAVLAYPADSLLSGHLLESLFPLHSYPTARELGEVDTAASPLTPLFVRTVRHYNAQAGALLRPALAAGRTGEVRTVVDSVLRGVLDRTPGFKTHVRQGLLIGCWVLIAFTLGWFARERTRSLRAEGARAEAAYGDAIRRVGVVGVCVALLLASPALARSEAIIADSVMKAIPHYVPPEQSAPVDTLVARGIDEQNDLQGTLRVLAGMQDKNSMVAILGTLGQRVDAALAVFDRLNARIAEMADSTARLRGDVGQWRGLLADQASQINRTTASLAGIRDSLRQAVAAVATQRRDMDALTDQLAKLGVALAGAQRRLDSLRGRELLVVENQTGGFFSIVRGGAGVARDSGSRAYWLPPDLYTVNYFSGEGGQRSMPADLRSGPKVAVLAVVIR